MRKVILIIIFLIVGCGSIQENVIKNEPVAPMVLEKPVEVQEIKEAVQILDDLEKIPKGQIDLRFYKGVTIQDFIFALSHGVPAVGFLLDFVESENELKVPRFRGEIKDLFKLLQETYGYSYRVTGNNVIISDNGQVTLKIPAGIADNEKNIKDLMSIFMVSPDDVHIDNARGVVVANMSAKQYRDLRQYLKNNDLSVYHIDMAIIETTANHNEKVGIDLENLAVTIGKTVENITTIKSSGSVIGISAGINGNISLDAVISAYGKLNEMRLDQRLRVGVTSGSSAKMDLSKKIPYVSQITATSGQTGSAVNGYTFETAQDGLVVEIRPMGDDQRVNIDTSINYQQVTDYLTINVGSAGSIQRPIVQARTYKAEYCIRPGEVALIGSLRVTNNKNKKTGPVLFPTFQDNEKIETDLSILLGVQVTRYKLI